jgi:hypothetical protein
MPVMKDPFTVGMPLAIVTTIFGPVTIETGMRASTRPPMGAGFGNVVTPAIQTTNVRKGASDG